MSTEQRIQHGHFVSYFNPHCTDTTLKARGRADLMKLLAMVDSTLAPRYRLDYWRALARDHGLFSTIHLDSASPSRCPLPISSPLVPRTWLVGERISLADIAMAAR